MVRVLLLFFVIVSCFVGHTKDLTAVDFSYLYRPNAPLEVSHFLTKKNDQETSVFLTVNKKIRGKFALSFFTQETYADQSEENIFDFNSDTISNDGNVIIAEYTFRSSDIRGLLVVVLSRYEVDYYFPIESNPGQVPSFIDFDDAPKTLPYLSEGPQFAGSKELYVYAYSTKFSVADPPFGIMQALSPSMEVDSLFLLNDSLKYQDWNFYFVQEDTNSSIGYGFIKTPKYFPRLRSIEELVEPLQYICSTKEFTSITQSENMRAAFEQFWIKNAGDQDLAKKNIARYFKGVTQANKLFSNYKPGWKTDQGMVSIVYGPPESVKKEDRKEVWTYQYGTSFEFVKISTLFAPRLFTLLRKPEYRDSWTEKIKTIRKGR